MEKEDEKKVEKVEEDREEEEEDLFNKLIYYSRLRFSQNVLTPFIFTYACFVIHILCFEVFNPSIMISCIVSFKDRL